jgi:transcriptional regulator with XRE-family HTH domain
LILELYGEGGLNMELRAAREKSGKTQAQIAKEANVGERLYQDYEYDKREPGVRTAIRIARALDSTVEELFGAATPDIEKSRTAIRRSRYNQRIPQSG